MGWVPGCKWWSRAEPGLMVEIWGLLDVPWEGLSSGNSLSTAPQWQGAKGILIGKARPAAARSKNLGRYVHGLPADPFC